MIIIIRSILVVVVVVVVVAIIIIITKYYYFNIFKNVPGYICKWVRENQRGHCEVSRGAT